MTARRCFRLITGLLLAGTCAHTTTAGATVLTFNEDAPNNPISDGSDIPQAYGDNVTAASDSGFTYDEQGEGFTPDVQTSYGQDTKMWQGSYGDLSNVVYDQESNGIFEMSLNANAGSAVQLHGFDLAGWPTTDYTINSLSVLESGGSPLFSANSVDVEGSNGHSDFDFSQPLTAQSLSIRFDASNLGNQNDNIGIDNVRFGQTNADTSVPAPAALGMLGVGLIGVSVARRRRATA